MIVVSRETRDRLDLLSSLIIEETGRQNLVSASTIPEFQNRHIDDSLQLLDHLPPGVILDIGSGAGLPGLVIACCRTNMMHLVEPRKRRAEFLAASACRLNIQDHVQIHQRKVGAVRLDQPAAAITARAVAKLHDLLNMADHLADEHTHWVLPKGRSAETELEEAMRLWHGDFRLKPSSTDPEASIVLATGVRRRMAR